MEVRKYAKDKKEEWDEFLRNSKKPLFMFERNYMEYHSERFIDNSLLFYDKKDRLIAIFPSNIDEHKLISHGGLTFGGFITDGHMRQTIMGECMEALLSYCNANEIEKIEYKAIPYIYHTYGAEEDIYELYKRNAIIKKIDPAIVLDLKKPLPLSKGRHCQVKRANKNNVEIVLMNKYEDYVNYMEIVKYVLKEKHGGAKPTHSADEIFYLHTMFPNEIELYCAVKDDKVISGAIVYIYKNVIHIQYMAANEEARRIGGLDYTIKAIIDKYSKEKRWLDFGTSSERTGQRLNEGLIFQKESFGGRTVVYSTYELSIK